VYYVQTEEEMKSRLLDMGLKDAEFDPRDGRTIAGEEMARLCRALAALEESLVALERRGISLKLHALRQDPVTGRLPYFHVYIGREEHWFSTREALDQFLAQREAIQGELRVENGQGSGVGGQGSGKNAETTSSNLERPTSSPDPRPLTPDPQRLHIVELHEVRSINNLLADLRTMGFEIDALVPVERTGSQEARYAFRRGEQETGLSDLRGLLAAVRAAGERGLQITRFKGLGEMNAEELRQTTLDPANRTLVQVTMEDAGGADEMFRVLMGDKVEPRREFIEKHALEVRNLDV
jgi:DNA gyrase subunit B